MGINYSYDGDGLRVGKSGGDVATDSVYYYFADALGSPNVVSTAAGAAYESCTNLPFGDNQTCSGGADISPMHFTGKPRDTETNLDYFGARYYNSGMARWMSPDWAAKPATVPYAQFGNPQSLNLYGYVTDNPVSRQDGDGHLMTIYQLYSWHSSAQDMVSAMMAITGEQMMQQIDANLQKAKQPPAQPAATAPPATGAAAAAAGAAAQKQKKPHKPKLPGTKLQRQLYRETSGLRGQNLHAARVAIAQTRTLNHSHERIAPDYDPNKPADARELSAIVHNPEAAAIFADVGSAIKESTTSPDTTDGATHFVLNYGQDLSGQKWYTGGSIENSFGPFTNTAGGDVPRGEDVDIEIVSYPPHF